MWIYSSGYLSLSEYPAFINFYRIDMIDLFKHFYDFTEDQVIGVANDLTPHYFDHAQDFIKQNPGTEIGSPGRFQVRKKKYCLDFFVALCR